MLKGKIEIHNRVPIENIFAKENSLINLIYTPGVADVATEIGKNKELAYDFTSKWNNFTFFTMFVGQTGGQAMKNSSYFWMDGEDKYSVNVRNSWTEETKETATYPRLTSLSSDNNFRSSDFWIYSTNRIDLAKVQLTYDFPKKALQKTFFSDFSVYALGSNLLTISENREIMELNIGGAPRTRYYNVGFKALF